MLRLPRAIRNLPTPAKVVGGVGLAAVAFRAASIGGDDRTFIVGPTAGIAAGIGAAVLLGSAAADGGLLGDGAIAAALGAGVPPRANPPDARGTFRHYYAGPGAADRAIGDGLRLPLAQYMALRELEANGAAFDVQRDAPDWAERSPYWYLDVRMRGPDGHARKMTRSELKRLEAAGFITSLGGSDRHRYHQGFLRVEDRGTPR